MSPLLEFDPARPCLKCGSENIGVQWHEIPVRRLMGMPTACEVFFPGKIGEHLCRSCRDCGYPWAEAVASPGPQDGLPLSVPPG